MIRLQLVWLNGLTVIGMAESVGTDGYATMTSGYLEEIMQPRMLSHYGGHVILVTIR